MKDQLTPIEKKIYDFIAESSRQQGFPPSVREIGDAVGLKSPSTVHFHLKKMARLGAIEKIDGKGRAIALKNSPGRPDGNRVPVVGDVAAGNPIPAQQYIEEYLAFDTGGHDDEYFALRVRGESMLNAGILPGDLVVVHIQQTAENGEIIVAMIDGEATVKRLARKRNHIWLMPENDDFSPIDGTHAEVLGRVAAVVRRYA